MRLILELKTKTNLKIFTKYQSISHVLVGVKGLSKTSANAFELNIVKELIKEIKKHHLKVIINCERLFSDDELLISKSYLKELPLEEVDYITYSDFGFFMLLKELNYQKKAIFRAPTYLTNACDVNLYSKQNAYVVLSSEISSEELKELSKKCHQDVIIDLFGKTECFYSRRKLLTNYFIYRGLDLDPLKKTYQLQEELRKEKMPIVEDETGTHIFESQNHYLMEELSELNRIAYGIIHTSFMTNKQIDAVCCAYDKVLNGDYSSFFEVLNKEDISLYKGAYDIKSVLLKGESSNE